MPYKSKRIQAVNLNAGYYALFSLHPYLLFFAGRFPPRGVKMPYKA
jgi:hypothetical protein